MFDPSGENPEFERTYGWAWLLKLAVELRGSPLDGERGWSSNLRPLSDSVADLFRSYLPDLLYPIRVGEHTNTAFGFIFALEYARGRDGYLASLEVIFRYIFLWAIRDFDA